MQVGVYRVNQARHHSFNDLEVLVLREERHARDQALHQVVEMLGPQLVHLHEPDVSEHSQVSCQVQLVPLQLVHPSEVGETDRDVVGISREVALCQLLPDDVVQAVINSHAHQSFDQVVELYSSALVREQVLQSGEQTLEL